MHFHWAISSLKDLIEDIASWDKQVTEKFSNKFDDLFFTPIIWFRGVRDVENHHLTPSIYRRKYPNPETKEDLFSQIQSSEKRSINEFASLNYHLFNLEAYNENDLFKLTLMQHYGLKTRFLDWTENALIAFSFALEPFFYGNTDINSRPCVYAINPMILNYSFFDIIRHDSVEQADEVSSFIFPFQYWIPDIKLYQNGVEKIRNDYSKSLPIALRSPYNSQRIKQQLGNFILFPYSDDKNLLQKDSEICLENYLMSEKFRIANKGIIEIDDIVRGYIIERPWKVYNEIRILGMKTSSLYPESPILSYEQQKNLDRIRQSRF
jgi:hypothetical protein